MNQKGPPDSLIKSALPSASYHLTPHGAAQPVWPGFLTGQAEQPVRVLLVDDDAPMRREIARELLADRRVCLVGQGSSVREGRQLISQSDFDVLLVDLNLGDGTGFALIEHLKTVRPAAEAIVISAMEDAQHALRAFELGATGYLVKNSWFGSFPQAVLQVVNGGASITPNLARRLLGKFEPAGGSAPAAANPHKARDVLSEREKAVLTLVAAGHTSTDIGTRLGIGSQTVNTHIKNIYRKLNVHNRAHAVSFAATHGLF
ncbi:response regulator transcription factor [Polaromonas glacialis]|uniref:response regulator transcription factor n=1 Tax=Polaromonas glacialis TaxID=866564 RepID=UPI000497FDE1|nr:response regulator transcription factor [Polaromonas glacialis]